jgi:Fe-S cluster biogenesis protein NfuA
MNNTTNKIEKGDTMNKESIIQYLEEFRKIIVTDGGDYEILSAEENYVKLKIKGKKNKKRSRDNLYALIKYTLKKKFPKEKIIVEYEHWIVPDNDTMLSKVKRFLRISNDK